MKTNWHAHPVMIAVAAALLASCAADRPRSTTPAPSAPASAPAAAATTERVSLSGASEVPPVSTGASGTANVSVAADCSVKAEVTVTGMTATAAHIHQGPAGANGPVIVPFNKTGDNRFAAADGAKMNEAQCAAYRKGETYVNVHSAAHPPGEVRAQLRGR